MIISKKISFGDPGQIYGLRLPDEDIGKRVPVLMLHGFTCSSADLTPLMIRLSENFFPLALDLTGHGDSPKPASVEPYFLENQVLLLQEVILGLDLKKPVLLGYSMGGRLATGFALKHQDLISALILLSTSFGIEKKSERLERLRRDLLLAESIEREGIEKFITRWMNLPLFSRYEGLPEEEYERIKGLKLRNSPAALACSLRGFSQGLMPSLWDHISEINLPTLLLTGETDKKFCEIAIQAHQRLGNSGHQTIANAGHCIHLENPDVCMENINRFLYQCNYL